MVIKGQHKGALWCRNCSVSDCGGTFRSLHRLQNCIELNIYTQLSKSGNLSLKKIILRDSKGYICLYSGIL